MSEYKTAQTNHNKIIGVAQDGRRVTQQESVRTVTSSPGRLVNNSILRLLRREVAQVVVGIAAVSQLTAVDQAPKT